MITAGAVSMAEFDCRLLQAATGSQCTSPAEAARLARREQGGERGGGAEGGTLQGANAQAHVPPYELPPP